MLQEKRKVQPFKIFVLLSFTSVQKRCTMLINLKINNGNFLSREAEGLAL